MKAAVIHGINDITVEEVPEPPVGPGDVKVRIAYCGLCGTDPENLEGRFGLMPPEAYKMDRIIGHEAAGTIAIVDDYAREYPAIEVDTSLDGRRVVAILERLSAVRGLPEVITIVNRPEFAGRALDEWAYRKGVKLSFIRPGKPMEHAYI
jgi:NADPH:quinone reductase-like Zn-dependent oxidoreductase